MQNFYKREGVIKQSL